MQVILFSWLSWVALLQIVTQRFKLLLSGILNGILDSSVSRILVCKIVTWRWPTTRDCGSVGVRWGQEFAFSTSSQVIADDAGPWTTFSAASFNMDICIQLEGQRTKLWEVDRMYPAYPHLQPPHLMSHQALSISPLKQIMSQSFYPFTALCCPPSAMWPKASRWNVNFILNL